MVRSNFSARLWLCAVTLVCGALACQKREMPLARLSGVADVPDDGQVVWFEGTCDASGAIPLDAQRFAVADDEDNVIRIYDGLRGGRPLEQFDLSGALRLPPSHEADLEAATRIGSEAYFLSSHGRTRDGDVDSSRLLFFGTSVPDSGQGLAVVGAPYRSLIQDLLDAPELAPFELQSSVVGGDLSIEGMTATPADGVLIGLRSPVPDGRALMLQLANPARVVRGEPAQFDGADALDLGGLGIRALSYWHGKYLILAGPTGDGGPFELYRWEGSGAPTLLERQRLSGLGPEGFFSHPARNEVMVLSDDGTRVIDGVACKRLSGPDQKRFRGIWLRLPA